MERPPALPEKTPPPLSYKSTIAVQLIGTASVSGYAGVPSFPQPYVTSNSLPLVQAGAGVSASDGRSTDEFKTGCGDHEYNRDSNGNSTSSVVSVSNDGTHTYGIALTAEGTTTGGFWKKHMLFICTDSYNTTAGADASARGDMHLSYVASPGTQDRILLRVDGRDAAQTSVHVTGVDGTEIPLTNLAEGRGQVFDLPGQGAYNVSATLSSSIAASGPSQASVTRTSNVTIQSLRDAIALGRDLTVVSNGGQFSIPLTIAVSPVDIESALKDALFTDTDGRFYPCRAQGADCKERDVYLANPKVNTDGAWIVLRVHVGGGVFIFGVDADVQLYGIPVVTDSVVRFDQLHLQTTTDDWLVATVSQLFHDKMLSALRQKAAYPYKARADSVLASIAKSFPIRWGTSSCLMLDPTHVSTPNVYNSGGSIIIDAVVSLKVLNASDCAKAPTVTP